MPKLNVLVLLCCSACATRAIKPESESASAHQTDAAHERAEANAHLQKYDPKQTSEHTVGGPGGGAEAVTVDSTPYNPTAWHLQKAEKLAAHAHAHEAAAAELKSFEAKECGGVSPRARAACPFMGSIVRIEDIDGGVRFVLADAGQVDSVVSQMRCHFAWARAHGFVELPDCPIYIKGIEVNRSVDGHSIDVTAKDRDAVTLLRERTHTKE